MLAAAVRGSERSQESRSRLRFPSFDVPPFSCHRHPTSSHRSRWGSNEGWVTWQSSPAGSALFLFWLRFHSGYKPALLHRFCRNVFFLFQ